MMLKKEWLDIRVVKKVQLLIEEVSGAVHTGGKSL